MNEEIENAKRELAVKLKAELARLGAEHARIRKEIDGIQATLSLLDPAAFPLAIGNGAGAAQVPVKSIIEKAMRRITAAHTKNGSKVVFDYQTVLVEVEKEETDLAIRSRVRIGIYTAFAQLKKSAVIRQAPGGYELCQ